MDTIPIDQPVKLATPVPGFTFFAEDQVLTAEQLNRLIQYLDYEQRASRAWLIGSGVVCGLTLTVAAAGDAVELAPGCALTSDGDLLASGALRRLTHVRKFEDKEANYAPFAGAAPLDELIASAEVTAGDGAVPLTSVALANKVVALYLESYVKQPDFCTSENCDNQGKIQHLNPRVLLLPRAKVDPLPSTIADAAVKLPDLASFRAKIQAGNIKKLEGADGLQSRFTTALALTRGSIIDAAKVLKEQADALAPVLEGDKLDWISKLPAVPDPKNEIPRLQDLYAFYRDFCEGYGEWKESLFAVGGECVPAIGAHPKHVLLGTAETTPAAGAQPYRHPFRRAAAIAGCPAGLRRSRLLWQRLRATSEAFIASRGGVVQPAKLTVTPSRDCTEPLGRRVLPGYYGSRYDGPWSIDAGLRGDPTPPLSPFNTNDSRLDQHGCAESFYRIDGHIGRPVGEVQKELEALRKTHNLAFQILAIQIEDDPTFAIPRPHRFFDLETAFFDQRTKFKLQLRDVDDFAGNLQSAIDAGRARIPTTAKEGIPAPDIVGTTDAAGQVRAQSKTALAAMPVKLRSVTSANSANFVTAYTETIAKSHIVNKNIGAIAGQVQFNPIDRIVQPEHPANWKILIDRFNKRTVKIAELSTFEKFVSANLGLEHLGGTPRGGTFILVYSASANEAGRIVKADFCLPYYSYFDLNSLDEEDDPAEPEDVTPDVRYVPPKWKDNYTWNISPVTDVAVGAMVDLKGVQLASALDKSLTTQVDRQFTAFTNLVPLFQTKDLAGVTGITAGVAGIKDPALSELQASLDKLTKERDDLARKVALKVAPDDAEKRIVELEKEISKNTEKGLVLVANEAKTASVENRAVTAEYETFTRTLADSAYSMQTEAGRKALGTVYENAATQNAGNAFVDKNVGRIGAMLKF